MGMIFCTGTLTRPLPRLLPNSSTAIFLLTPSQPTVAVTSPFCVSATNQKRIGKRVRDIPEFKRKAMAKGPWWKQPPVVMTSPLSRTTHPEDRWEEVENELEHAVKAASEADMPLSPITRTPSSFLSLCPR